MSTTTMAVTKTLSEVADGVFAYTQLPGSWGWSNAGLVASNGESLLVDTLFDLSITREMLDAMAQATPAARRIGTVVNTHGNGDHCYGNALVRDAEIVATRGCVEDLRDSPPQRLRMLMRAGGIVQRLGPLGRALGRGLRAAGVPQLDFLVDAAALAVPYFADFDFPAEGPVLPSRTFEGTLTLDVGGERVDLVEVGPAHTRGDAFAYLPEKKVVFTGDLLFKDAHPVIWEGPVSNWIAACRRLLALDVDVVVPGHGPVGDKTGLEETVAYLEYLDREARARFAAGMSAEEAARDISFADFRAWHDAERVYVNVRTVYRDLAGDPSTPDVLELFAGMARHQAALA